MRIIEIEIVNYKKIENLKVEFGEGNVFLVQGNNNEGKTTFVKSIMSLTEAKDNTPEPVTTGKSSGSITGKFKGADGKIYVVKREFSNKKDKFTLVSEDKTTSKVTDIRDVFQYNAFTPEQFVGYGLTADGRRRQRDVVLGLMGEKTKDKFLSLLEEEKEKYDLRTETKKDIDRTKDTVEVSEEDLAIYNKKAINKETLVELREQLSDANLAGEKKENLGNIFNGIVKCVTELDNVLRKQEIVCNKELKTIKKIINDDYIAKAKGLEKVDTTKLAEDIEKEEALQESIIKIGTTIEQSEKNGKMLDEYNKTWIALDRRITAIREEKTKLIAGGKLPIDNIVIKEDGIYFIKDKQEYEFNAEQISTSEIMMVTCKILLAVNKTTPIIFLGRSESLGKEMLGNISSFAKENGSQLFCDRVLEQGELQIVGYELEDVVVSKAVLPHKKDDIDEDKGKVTPEDNKPKNALKTNEDFDGETQVNLFG